MNDELFKDALATAWVELKEIEKQERQMAIRKAQLRKTVNSLLPLVNPDFQTDINEMSLPNAIRFIFSSTGRALSANDIRVKLDELGYDTAKLGDNPTANILTALKRMEDGDELKLVPDEKKKTFEPGPELKPPPEPPAPPDWLDELHQAAEDSKPSSNALADRVKKK